ncbi:MAG: protein kinase [Lentisphaeria bacterium]|nr:protein kinase [Lentisphaeria bacterium]
MIIRCPHCKKENELEHLEQGKAVLCPACHTMFILDDVTAIKDYSGIDTPPPEKIGPYSVERFLGKDGMGRMYKGKHPDLDIPVTIKVLPREYANNAEFCRRFEKACKICKEITHPNFIKVYECGTDEHGSLYLVTEYEKGETVADILLHSGPLSPAKTAEIATAVCSALAAAAKKGIVYNDIRPENILVTANGKCKLINPELAKYGPGKDAQQKTAQNTSANKEDTLELISLGTPEYMAPEQFIDVNHCDSRADIYSLGVSIYQMLAGRLPFEAKSRSELRRFHFETEPKIPGVYRPNVPFDMEYIAMLCLRKKKTERYQTPEELLADLEAYMNGLPLPSTNDNILAASGKSYGKTHPVVKNILVKNQTVLRRFSRWVEISVIGILAAATTGLLLERKYNHGKETQEHTQQTLPYRVMNRADIWVAVQENAKTALQKKTGFAKVIADLKSFENDEDANIRKTAVALISELQIASDKEVRKLMNQLELEAQPHLEEHNYLAACEVFERKNPLFTESRELRMQRLDMIRKAMKEYSQQLKLNRAYLEKYVIPHLAAGDYKKALDQYKSKENPGKDSSVLNVLRECIQIPELFAESLRSASNQECKFFFRKEPFDSWRKQGNLTIAHVVPPFIYLTNGGSFTIRDLDWDEQEHVIRLLKNVSEQALALWCVGMYCYSAPETAETHVEKLPFSLQDSYQTYLKKRIVSKQVDAFRKDLQQLLETAGYRSKDLPSPEQLPDLAVLSAGDPEKYIPLIEKMQVKYHSLPAEEQAYLDALIIIRNNMEKHFFHYRQQNPQFERDQTLLIQEAR